MQADQGWRAGQGAGPTAQDLGTAHEFAEPETCTGEDCKDWMVKLNEFQPSYQGGGGGGGGATFVFRAGPRDELVPLLVAGGGGGLQTR